ncbi:MAG: ABC transporter ATP-binding protein [Desulfurococcales archaeon]|jgi:peptide/nickel transport system ATP-binding protein|nr:ABC transporter ATP-binding protein [Desulfurococcales archaeon]
MEKILEISDLRIYYYLPQGIIKAVDGVSFDIYKGEIFGIAGESGSGKSTLALAISGLLRPPAKVVSGRILFMGRDLLSLDSEELRKIRGKEISMIFQDPSTYLNPVYTTGLQVAEVFEAHRGGSARKYLSMVVKLFRMVKIADPERRVNAYPHQMSGGMKQRVLISMAIAERPKLIVADEPTSALDVTIQAEIVELLNEIRRETGSSIIFITHDLALLLEIADRIMIMYAGKVAEIGRAEEIAKDPLHPYTKALLASLRYERKKRLQSIPGSIPSLISPPPGCRFHPRCQYAMDICSKRDPDSININGRIVSCFLYGDHHGGDFKR